MNHAVECSTVCKASTYAVLKGHMCFCLRDIRDLVPLDARECDLQCPGAPGEMCGGPRGAVSVYSMGGVNGFKETDSEKTSLQEQTVHEMSRSDWKNCVYILKHDTPVWITTDCRKTLPFLCKIYRERGTIIEYKSPRRKTGSWLEARAMCREEGGTLADIHSNNMAAVQALPNHSEYWVGLYRNTSWTWHTDDVIETPLWCTTVVEDKVGELQFQTETCSMPHDFVCQIPIPVAKADASHLVVYVVCGSVVWVLAVVTGIVVFCMLRRRGWCRKNDTTGLSQSSYLDMDDQTPRLRPATSRPPRPLSHSYVNSDVSNAPSSSRTSQFSNDSPPLKSKSAHAQDKPKPAIGNEYASVCMSKIQSEGKEFDRLETGACASGYKNAEGEYDIVWDSEKFSKHLKMFGCNSDSSRNSTTSENVYTDIEKVSSSEYEENTDSEYISMPCQLFPPSELFGEHQIEGDGKQSLCRKKSQSL
ncbi:uncharacterized protein LOC127882273 isoform X1 [Dreissena polymorpha]|uniref:uncharacterized protein LOC127882273 isoform X1 n=1 Tax=Dreissena polymorpha TaxID=45954 RepID=UPI0022644CB1|nr:uncharacterized protein LOC127882273 isoform X1 [Dreissena polymorpha]